MAATKTTPTLGEGIFTAYDAAHILDIRYGKVNYWFNNQVKEQFRKTTNHNYFFDYQDIRAVNFFSLIELFVFNALRTGKDRLKPKKIIEYHAFLSSVLNTPYPFATSRWLRSGNEIILSLDEWDSQLVSANSSFQLLIRDVIEPYTKRIVFDVEDGLAFKYYPLADSKNIVVNRYNQFGQPVIEGTNIKTSTIFTYHTGGESIESIAELYNLTKDQVEDAIEYANAA